CPSASSRRRWCSPGGGSDAGKGGRNEPGGKEESMPLIDDIKEELDTSDPGWLAGFSLGEANCVATVSTRFWANETERGLIQKMGAAHGCHTCNRTIDLTEQIFIVDHIPPRELNGPDGAFRFFPHCDACAARQSGLVRAFTGTKIMRIIREKVGRLAS